MRVALLSIVSIILIVYCSSTSPSNPIVGNPIRDTISIQSSDQLFNGYKSNIGTIIYFGNSDLTEIDLSAGVISADSILQNYLDVDFTFSPGTFNDSTNLPAISLNPNTPYKLTQAAVTIKDTTLTPPDLYDIDSSYFSLSNTADINDTLGGSFILYFKNGSNLTAHFKAVFKGKYSSDNWLIDLNNRGISLEKFL